MLMNSTPIATSCSSCVSHANHHLNILVSTIGCIPRRMLPHLNPRQAISCAKPAQGITSWSHPMFTSSRDLNILTSTNGAAPPDKYIRSGHPSTQSHLLHPRPPCSSPPALHAHHLSHLMIEKEIETIRNTVIKTNDAAL